MKTETKEKMKTISNKFLNIFFPEHIKCVFCGEELNENSINDTCEICQQILPYITRPCLRCGEQLEDGFSNICVGCYKNNHAFTKAISVFEYTEKVVALVHKFKYGGKKFLLEPISKYMCELFATQNIDIDTICDVPMFKEKLKTRKYNHSTLLAKNISKTFNIKYLPLLTKVKDNPSQTTLSYTQRRENVKDCYAINKDFISNIKNKNILIIDDVITTCATIDEISSVLKHHGAKDIFVLSFAHTSINRKENSNK